MSTSTISGLLEASESIESGRFGEAELTLRQLIGDNSEQYQELESGQLFSMLALTLEEQGDYPGALNALTQAARVLEAAGDDQSLPHVFLRMALIYRIENNQERERVCLERALATAEASGNGPMLLMVNFTLGLVAHRHGEYAESLLFFDKAAEINQFVKDLDAAELIGREREQVERILGLHRVALREFQRRRDELSASGDLEGADRVRLAACGLSLAVGSLAEAVEQLRSLARVRSERGVQDEELGAVVEQAQLFLDQNRKDDVKRTVKGYLESTGIDDGDRAEDSPGGSESAANLGVLIFGSDEKDIDEVIAELEVLKSEAAAAGDRNKHILALAELGRTYHEVGQLELAQMALQEAWSLSSDGDSRDSYTMQTLAGRRLVSVLLDLKSYDPARKVLQSLILQSRRHSDARGEVYALLELGSADFFEGTGDRGRKHLREALQRAQNSGDQLGHAEALLRLARIDSDEDHTRAAIKKLRSAVAISRRIGSKDILYNALRALTNLYWEDRNYHTRKLSQEAQAIALEAGRISDYAQALRDESSASQALKQYDRALEEAIRTLRAHQSQPPSSDEAVAFFQIGSILRDMDRRREALEFMTVGAWLSGEVSSENTFTHEEHISLMSVRWNMELALFELAASAGKRYGENRGETMVNEMEASLRN